MSVVFESYLQQPDGKRVDVPLCLAPGSWTVHATAADGAAGEATQHITRGGALDDPIVIPLRR